MKLFGYILLVLALSAVALIAILMGVRWFGGFNLTLFQMLMVAFAGQFLFGTIFALLALVVFVGVAIVFVSDQCKPKTSLLQTMKEEEHERRRQQSMRN